MNNCCLACSRAGLIDSMAVMRNLHLALRTPSAARSIPLIENRKQARARVPRGCSAWQICRYKAARDRSEVYSDEIFSSRQYHCSFLDRESNIESYSTRIEANRRRYFRIPKIGVTDSSTSRTLHHAEKPFLSLTAVSYSCSPGHDFSIL